MPSSPLARAGAALCLGILAAAPASAWGPAAHRAVGDVVEARLCPAAREHVRALLGDEPLAEAGVWPDKIRDDPRWRHTADWHYADVGDDEPLARAWDGDRGRLLLALNEQTGILASGDADAQARRDALGFVVHLLADLHQPLHVGRPSDRGGNAIPVRLGDRETNLHQAWDSGLLARGRLGRGTLASAIGGLVDAGLVDTGGGLGDWAAESVALRSRVYDFDTRRKVPVLSARYEITSRQIAVVRLAQSAARLQATLEDLWCPAEPQPAAGRDLP